MENIKVLSPLKTQEQLRTLRMRFEKNMHRHKHIAWLEIKDRLEKNPEKLWPLHVMETTGGEPDVKGYDRESDKYIFFDFSSESPLGRRSLCYDPVALAKRKEHKPKSSAVGMALEMGIELLTEEQYRELQQLENVDKKTSSWILTPPGIRDYGGAIFGDFRYGTVFIYHNSAESYYASRGFRGSLRL